MWSACRRPPRPRQNRSRFRRPRATTGPRSIRCSTTVATTRRPVGRWASPTATTTGRTSTSSTRRTTTATPTCPRRASTGCEAGAGPSATPSATSAATRDVAREHHPQRHACTSPCPCSPTRPPTQCTATATCIDHPPTIDLSRIASALPGNPSPSSVSERADPGSRPRRRHTQQRPARSGGTSRSSPPPAPSTFSTLTSVAAINAAVNAWHGDRRCRPTHSSSSRSFPGTVPAGQAANLTATAPPGPAVATAPTGPPASQVESGTTFNNLNNDCGATAPNCQNVGISHDWIDGQDVEALYTEPFYLRHDVSCGAFEHRL